MDPRTFFKIAAIFLAFLAASFLAGGAIYLVEAEDVILTFQSTIDEFWNRIYYMFALAVLVERSVEVYLKIGNLDGGKVNPKTGGVTPPATVNASVAALAISIILAIVGVRALETLVMLDIIPPEPGEPATGDKVLAKTIFYGIDVLISAGLMAGGSVVFHPLIKSLTLVFEGMQAGAQGRLDAAGGRSPSPSAQGNPAPAEQVDLTTDEFADASAPQAAIGLTVAELNLIEPALTGANKLKEAHPDDVVFLSGRRTVAAQAKAMADNVLLNRKWIEETYALSNPRTALQKWVDDNPEAVTASAIATGLAGVMAAWSDSDKLKISRHLAGLAFDVKPVAGATGTAIKTTIRGLPNLRKFLEKEGGLVRWHAEFKDP